MTRRHQPLLSAISFLLLLQVISFVVQRPVLFVNAKNVNVLRGSNTKKISLDDLPHRELPEASWKQDKLVLKNNDIEWPSSGIAKVDKEFDSPTGMTVIEKEKDFPTGIADIEKEKEPDRSDINPTNFDKENLTTESPTWNPLPPPRWAPTWNPLPPPTTITTPTSNPVSAQTMAPSSDPVSAPTMAPSFKPTGAPTLLPSSTSVFFDSKNLVEAAPIPLDVKDTIEPLIDTILAVTKPSSSKPTVNPTSSPSSPAIVEATGKPSVDTMVDITKMPSYKPTESPTASPSKKISQAPSSSTPEPTISALEPTKIDSNSVFTENLLLSTVPTSQVSVDDFASNNKTPSDTTRPDNNESVDVKFDETKFVAGEKLQPIIFDMTVSNFTQILNTNELQTYFIGFIEDLLDMRSNKNWYPFHLKSVSNITIELVSEIFVEGDKEEHADPIIQKPVQLIITGLVFVHAKKQEAGTVASSKTTVGGTEKQAVVHGSAPSSSFHDSFYHSMLLYLTFWGADSLQKVLDEDGGLQNPIISSVSVGEKELIAFGIDKDDNYLYKGDHDSSKPKNLPAQVNTGIISGRPASSAASSKFGFLTISMMSAGMILRC